MPRDMPSYKTKYRHSDDEEDEFYLDEEYDGFTDGRRKIDKAKPFGKITGADFKALRSMKKEVEETLYELDLEEEDVEEGNAFSGALSAARERGDKTFRVGNKTYPVEESYITEKWKGDVEVKSTGEYADMTIDEIDTEIKKIKKRNLELKKLGKKVPSSSREKMGQLYFAKRAKKDWPGKGKAKVEESRLIFTENEMMEKLKLKSGDIYNEENLRLDIQTLTEMYQDKGYAFANVLRTLEVVPGENKVDVVFSFEKGVIAYFGKITMKGNTKTRDKVLRRELRIHEGDMYSGSKLRISKDNVNRLGFFQPESVVFNTITRKGTDNILDVEISIKERPTGQISLGAGYSTATQGFIQASVAQNNFRGLGQNINANLSYSNRQQIYNLGFTEPYLFDSRWTAGADYYQTLSFFIFTYCCSGCATE
jgi:outer membrane translocation and assembly module TamA